MGRSGYTDDCDDNWNQIRWRGQVMSAIRGKRGQKFLKELICALHAMPEKKLIRHELIENGQVCAMGAVGLARGINLEELDPYDYDMIADKFGIAHQLVREIEWENDECCWGTPEERWQKMLEWAERHLNKPATERPEE